MRDHRVLLFGFALSNMAALVYEVVWGRELGYVFGTTVYAISTVLTAFMAGLALGSFFFGRLADKRDPVRLFAFLELGIGIYGIVTIWLFGAISHPFLIIARYFSGAPFLLLQVLLAFAVLIVPTTFIGGTFPVMSKIHARRFKELGAKVGTVYSLDTLGAAAGAFLSGFLLIPRLGLDTTTLAAALVNLAVGATVYYRFPQKALRKPTPQRKDKPTGFEKVVLASFFLSGFAALAYEIAWTRLLTIVFSTSVYAFSLILTAFMAGLALGSHLMGRVVDRLKDPVGVFVYVEFGIGICAILLLFVFSRMDLIFLELYFKLSHSFPALFSSFFLVFFLLFLVPTTLMGSTMPLVSRIFPRSASEIGTDVGLVFSSNTAGGILGSLAGGFLLIPLLGTEKTVLTVALLNALAGGLLLRYSSLKKETILGVVAVFLVITAGFSTYAIDPQIGGVYYHDKNLGSVDIYRVYKHKEALLFKKWDPNGLVTVTKGLRTTTLRINGKAEASDHISDTLTEYMIAYAPLMLHPDPEDVLNIGLGGGFTLSATEDFEEVKSIDVVEINPAVVEATLEIFPELNDHALDDPRVNLVVTDARNFLFVNEKKYDVIISEPSNPWLAGEGALFTQEFYTLAKSRLKDGGVFTHWLPFYNLNRRDLKMLLNTFQSVFPYVQIFVTNPGDMIVVGSLTENNYDYVIGKGRFDSPMVKKRLIGLEQATMSYGYVLEPMDYFFSFYFMNPTEVEDYIKGIGEFNTDDKPSLEFASAMTNFGKTPIDEASFSDIIQYKIERDGAVVTSPPISNLVATEEQRDVFGLFGIEVAREPDWSLNDVGYGLIQHPETGDYYIQKSTTYSTGRGELSWTRIDNVQLNLSREEMLWEIAASFQGVPLTFLETVKKGPYDMHIFTDGQKFFAGWQCGKPNINVLILPAQDMDDAKEVFEKVNCITS
jgi:spermidine synthase